MNGVWHVCAEEDEIDGSVEALPTRPGLPSQHGAAANWHQNRADIVAANVVVRLPCCFPSSA